MIDRIKHPDLHNRIVTAQEAASWIKDGMVLGLSGFGRSSDAKVIPLALVEKSKTESFQVDVYTGASLGPEVDQYMVEAGIIRKRAPYQAERSMRQAINSGLVLYTDMHLSHNAELIRNGIIGPFDFAIIEASAITEDGLIIPTNSVGNGPIFAQYAKKIIIELNTKQPQLEGIHDIYVPDTQGSRQPIPLCDPADKIGERGIRVDLDKIAGIVHSELLDAPALIVEPDEETEVMANHLIDFLKEEVASGRVTEFPIIQSGVGSVANAVLNGFLKSDLTDLELYSEVLQDAVFDLIEAGKIKVASGTALTLSERYAQKVYRDFERYAPHIILRPQEISNHPELIRRLGLVAINTALEVDLYGNVNSTHVFGTHIMNGIGGSGDYARNARIGIFVTKSAAKNGTVSSIVPMVSHHDHTEHDVDVIITEQGVADLRGLAPKERVAQIIEHCAHPDFREALWDYYDRAVRETNNAQTPHILAEAFSWHIQYAERKKPAVR